MAAPTLELVEGASLEPRSLSAGVVAFDEERNLRPAVQSLIDQKLPRGVTWREIWVVASGCTDGTVGVAEALARQDPRVRLVVEPDRGGKARALGEVFRRASGDALVLLNSDARAEPGAVDQLIRTARGKAAPFAVMGRPVVPHDVAGRWGATMRWMWELHHEFHAELLAEGCGNHLSDELLMVSLATVPPIPPGIINDGSYLAVWLEQHGGGRWYAPEAWVSIQVPSNVRDHLHQRRRIHVGNDQVAVVLGAPPTSLPRRALERPAETLRLVRRLLEREGGFGHFARVASCELASHALAVWDRLPPRKDHIRWQRIRSPTPSSRTPATGDIHDESGPRTEERVASILRVANEFGTGVPLGRLHELLPTSGPPTVDALRRWLEERPTLARLEGPRAYAPTTTLPSESGREERGRFYRQHAESLWNGPLAFAHPMVRCVGLTGSVAFGEPRPGDDLDLFVVTRSGTLWWFLARTYFALLRANRRPGAHGGPTPCLNYVLEDASAAGEFARRSDLLFAREALSVQVLAGDDYYRGLVASAPWIRTEIPRLFDLRSQLPGRVDSLRAPLGTRVLNLVVFPLLAAYLQLAGLVRNARHRRRGSSAREFRTETRLRRLAFASHRFDQLRDRYATARTSARPTEGEGRSGEQPGGPRMPAGSSRGRMSDGSG